MSGRKRGSGNIGTSALRMQCVPYFRMGWTEDQIAPLVGRSAETVKGWRSHPDVVAALGEITEHVVEATKARAEDLVVLAFEALQKLVAGAEDERVQLDAAKTILDRFGHPVQSKSEVTGKDGAPVGGGPVIVISADVARQLAREESDE